MITLESRTATKSLIAVILLEFVLMDLRKTSPVGTVVFSIPYYAVVLVLATIAPYPPMCVS